jgi:hypothetical protein
LISASRVRGPCPLEVAHNALDIHQPSSMWVGLAKAVRS